MDSLRQVLQQLTRPSRIPGMVGELIPDPIAQDLLSFPALDSVAAQLRAYGINQLQPLGYGASSVVLDAGDGRVVRLGIGHLVSVPSIPEVVQPLAAGMAGPVRFEIMPRAETRYMTDADVREIAIRLAQRGYEFSDAGIDNIGRLDGRVVVIDPGAVTERPRRRGNDDAIHQAHETCDDANQKGTCTMIASSKYDVLRAFPDVKAMLEKVQSPNDLDELNNAVQERFMRNQQLLAMTETDWKEWTILLARKSEALAHTQAAREDQSFSSLAAVRHAVQEYRDSRPIDRYDYDRRLDEIQTEIVRDWAEGNPDDYSYSYGPAEILKQMQREGNIEHFDADGDLTAAGWKRRDTLEVERSALIARGALGEPQRETVDLTRPDHMADFLHRYLDSVGFDPRAIGGSGKSLSKYFDVPVGQGNYSTIRISDHKLPGEYTPSDIELTLYDVSDDDVRADGRERSISIAEDEAIRRAAGVLDAVGELRSRGALGEFLDAHRGAYTAATLDADKGTYRGPFVFINDHYAIQSLGRGSVVAHDIRGWDEKPKLGQSGVIRYRAGVPVITLKTKMREQNNGRGT